MPRGFGPNVVIDGTSLQRPVKITRYESDVHTELLSVLAFDTGRAVINEIWSRPKRLRIRPWLRQSRNATASPADDRAATAPFHPVRDAEDGHHEAAWGHGTGRGSNVVIRYSPKTWGDDRLPAWDPTARNNWAAATGVMPPLPGEESGEVLLHEMVHALRQMSGRETGLPMRRGFDTQEEFFAVLITNVYTSERGPFRQLRGDHGTAPLLYPSSWRRDREFQALIRAITVSHPSLVRRLARVRAQFNPFAGVYDFDDPGFPARPAR
ncbi:MAG: hypothetical protein AB1898_04210 [Acidobacteriota bacterium]